MSTKKVKNLTLGEKLSQLSGKRLRKARDEAGLSQDGVAEILGKDNRSTISKWENGKANPSFKELAIMSILYGADPAYLIGVDFVEENSPESLALDKKAVRIAEKSVSDVETHVNELIKRKLPPGVSLEDLEYYLRQLQFFLKALEDSEN